MLEKVDMKTRTLKTLPLRGNAGFTAIEIAMVAAVIAILSLIVLPIFRNRVEDAKSQRPGRLSALMKAEQVVKADIDAYARLEDLDNVELFGYTAIPATVSTKEVPFFKYVSPSDTVSPDPNTRQVLNAGRSGAACGNNLICRIWRGPYIAFQRAITYKDIKNGAITCCWPVFYYGRQSGNSYQAAIQDV